MTGKVNECWTWLSGISFFSIYHISPVVEAMTAVLDQYPSGNILQMSLFLAGIYTLKTLSLVNKIEDLYKIILICRVP